MPDDRQALLLAMTATRVQDDAAIDYLVRLRTRAALPIRTELAQGWRHFDTERYAEEIIAHLAPDDLYFPVSDAAELAALRELGGRARIQVAGVRGSGVVEAQPEDDQPGQCHQRPHGAAVSG